MHTHSVSFHNSCFWKTTILNPLAEPAVKNESMGAPGRCATCYVTDFNETLPV